MQSINVFVQVLFSIFTLSYLYQYLYIFVAWLGRRKPKKNEKKNSFSILICARNEKSVIEKCIESIFAQNYPRELIKVFVCADNCTDNTAELARAAGATVYERFNKNEIGKGYALEFLFERIKQDDPDFADAYVIFDADNIVDGEFLTSMNDMLGEGYNVSTCYRNTKNYSDSLIAACSGLWFLRESKYLNHARMTLDSGCAVSGTGFMISKPYLEKIGGWHYHILIEDIQFSVECALSDEKIGYCRSAVVYDEQPVKFKTSWNQRMRWCKGYFQLLIKYGGKLIKKMLAGSFTCFDMFMNLSPAYFISIVAQFVFVGGLFVSFFTGRMDYVEVLKAFAGLLFSGYVALFLVGAITTATEWKQIHADWLMKIVTVFVFPLYMSTYLPITILSLFSKPCWKPIEHTSGKSIKDFGKK
ncbi:MAG: glycosyltransferase family 2 protein [Clostridia bacterium]|nr:glycosyltransferase family 2 protein [Clostridia bacterium]